MLGTPVAKTMISFNIFVNVYGLCPRIGHQRSMFPIRMALLETGELVELVVTAAVAAALHLTIGFQGP